MISRQKRVGILLLSQSVTVELDELAGVSVRLLLVFALSVSDVLHSHEKEGWSKIPLASSGFFDLMFSCSGGA